jgi:hypothetical protein
MIGALFLLDVFFPHSQFIEKWDFYLGAGVGLATDIIVTLWASLNEFSSSTASYRVDQVIEATQEILQTKYRSRARDRHRYSLGVVIDHLEQVFGKDDGFRKNEWPCLVHHTQDEQPLLANRDGTANDQADRWDFFDLYVRPVVDDINGFSFIGKYPIFPRIHKKTRQLKALTKLCTDLEIVVRELDAAFETKTKVRFGRVLGKVVIQPVDSSDESIGRLREAYRSLYKAWCEWLKASGTK